MTYRQILAFPQPPGRPGRIIMDVYEDGYTPLDVMAAVVIWMTEDHVALESFRQYVNEHTEEITGGEFTGDEAITHVSILHRLLCQLWQYPDHVVYVQGSEGWVN